jgi:hypothetical protein
MLTNPLFLLSSTSFPAATDPWIDLRTNIDQRAARGAEVRAVGGRFGRRRRNADANRSSSSLLLTPMLSAASAR